MNRSSGAQQRTGVEQPARLARADKRAVGEMNQADESTLAAETVQGATEPTAASAASAPPMQLPVPAGAPEDVPANTAALGARLSAARDRGLAVAEDLWQRSGPTRAWLVHSADGLVARARARAESVDTGALLAAVPGLSRWSKSRADAPAIDASASETVATEAGTVETPSAQTAASEGTTAAGSAAPAGSAEGSSAGDSAPAPADTSDRSWRARLAALPALATPVMAQGRQAVDKVTSLIARRAELATLPKPSRLRTGIRSLQEYVQNKAMKESAAMGSQAAEWVNRLDSKGRFAVITRHLTPSGNTTVVGASAAATAETVAAPVDAPASSSPKPRTRKPRSAESGQAADVTATAPVKRVRKAAAAKDPSASAAQKPTRAASRSKAKASDAADAIAGEAGAEPSASAPRARKRAPAKTKVVASPDQTTPASADAPEAAAQGSSDQPTA